MNTEILTAIIELVKEGGQAAVYITIMHYTVSLLTNVLGFGILGYAICKTSGLIKYGMDQNNKS